MRSVQRRDDERWEREEGRVKTRLGRRRRRRRRRGRRKTKAGQVRGGVVSFFLETAEIFRKTYARRG
jgi:hypothetical protein